MCYSRELKNIEDSLRIRIYRNGKNFGKLFVHGVFGVFQTADRKHVFEFISGYNRSENFFGSRRFICSMIVSCEVAK